MATHCSILAWEIPWTEEPGGLQSKEVCRGVQKALESDTTQQLNDDEQIRILRVEKVD